MPTKYSLLCGTGTLALAILTNIYAPKIGLLWWAVPVLVFITVACYFLALRDWRPFREFCWKLFAKIIPQPQVLQAAKQQNVDYGQRIAEELDKRARAAESEVERLKQENGKLQMGWTEDIVKRNKFECRMMQAEQDLVRSQEAIRVLRERLRNRPLSPPADAQLDHTEATGWPPGESFEDVLHSGTTRIVEETFTHLYEDKRKAAWQKYKEQRHS